LAICGTVNDLAVSGARPLGIAMSLILTEGLAKSDLEVCLDSAAAAAKEAGVEVITGDTKVVGADKGDGLYITTAGLGLVPVGRRLHPDQVRPGDVILINGPIADHGLAVMLAREMPEVHSVLRSDVAPLNGLVEHVLAVVGGIPGVPLAACPPVPGHWMSVVRFMRDPTRGGLGGLAADLAARTGYHVVLEEEAIPVRPETRHAADMLGLDVLDVANEGKVVIVIAPEAAENAMTALRQHPLGREARIIGRIESQRDGLCELHTNLGGRRIVQKPYGEQLPRIC
jgi:hydrogenase expression/formation protein HypE